MFLHPVGKTQELCGGQTLLTVLFQFVVFNLHHTLRADCEVLSVQSLLILNYDQVVGAVVGWRHWLSVAVEELDWHVGSMLCEETYSLVACLDGLDHVPARSVFADEVSLAQLSDLVVRRSLSVDDPLELFEVNGIRIASSGFNFFFVVVILFVKLRDATLALNWVPIFIVLHLFHILHVSDHAACLAGS